MAINSNSIEELLKAIDIIASQRASENNAYDQTIVCTITDNSKAEQFGYYTVTNDTITFDAYSDNLEYKVGNYVRVSIPNGDFSQQKYITGLYQYNNGEVISYVSPLDTFMDVGVLVDNRAPKGGKLVNPQPPAPPVNANEVAQPYAGLIANGQEKNFQYIEAAALESKDWELDSTKSLLQATGIYDTIGLQADFKCTLGNAYDIRTGSYGIELQLKIKLNENGAEVIHTVRLDSADFFGDPYNFKVYSTQAQAYDISNLGGTVVGFNVKPYQRDDFMYYDGQALVSLPADSGPNIFVSNIYVALGCDLYKMDNHTVQLYTTDTLTYRHEPTDVDLEISNTKHLSVLWYNKDNNSKHLGFGDGKYSSSQYSELNYIQEAAEDRRLRGRQSDEVYNSFGALDAADRYYKALPLIQKLIGYVENSIVKKLYSFKRDLTGFAIAQVAVDKWASDLKNNVVAAKQQLETFEAWKNNLVSSNWHSISHGEIEKSLAKLLEVSSGILIKEEDGLRIIAPGIKEAVIQEYINYRGVYEQYSNDLLKLLVDYDAIYNQLFDEIEGQIVLLNKAKSTKNNTPFVAKDFSTMDNYYDIFWYRYNPEYTTPDNFMEVGWEPINTKMGVPSQEDPDNPGYLIKNCPNEENLVKVLLNEETHTERFVVVIVYNHVAYYSNELVFNNLDEFADESDLNSNAIYIEHGDNSRDTYQTLYSSGNQLLNQSEASINRAISLRCKEEYGGDRRLSGATLYWYIPTSSTMLHYDREFLEEKGFMMIDEQEPSESIGDTLPKGESIPVVDDNYKYFRPGYACFYKTLRNPPKDDASSEEFTAWNDAIKEDLKFYYSILEYLNPGALRNEIECLVVIENETDKAELMASIRLVFGALGTNGTNYTLVVMPATKQYCVTGFNESGGMPITAALYDYDGNEVTDVNIQYSWKEPVNGDTVPTNYNLNDPAEGEVGTKIIYNMNGTTGVGILTVGIPGVSIKSGDTRTDTIARESSAAAGNPATRTRYVDLFVQYPISWGNDKSYYIAGATTITYSSNGSNPEYYKGPYVLYGQDHKPIDNISWSMEWYDQEQNLITAESEGYDFYKNYMPLLSSNNTIIPSPMFVSGCQCYPVVIGKDSGGTEVWRQPLVITQNRYPSKFLNAWDGSLQIDEENGTIMANMIGAGKKETDNSFSGVLMGEVENVQIDTERDAVLNRNHSGVGLYGFHHGQQSFGFNADGTAFIGKSGGGRISFDGNQGFIYSDNWLNSFTEQVEVENPTTGEVEIKTQFIADKKPFTPIRDDSENILYYELGEGKDGMAIDLRSGHIDANNFRLRSENIKMTSGRALDDEDKYILSLETSLMEQDLKPVSENAFNSNQIYYIYDAENKMYVRYDGDAYPENDTLYILECMIARPNDSNFTDNPDQLEKEYYYLDGDGYVKYPGSAYPAQIILYEAVPVYEYKVVLNNDIFPGFEGYEYYTKENGVYSDTPYEGTEYPENGNLYQRTQVGTRYESRTKEQVVEPLTNYFIYDANTKSYVAYDKETYPESIMLYESVQRDKGYYYIKFDRYGNLELSISDATFLAEKNITIGEYFENIDKEIVRIEDEVIGVPPELQDRPIFDHFTGKIDDIKDSVLEMSNNLTIQAEDIKSYVDAQSYLTTEGVFNGLTNNGAQQGIFCTYVYTKDENGNEVIEKDQYGRDKIDQIYINASYISTGILRSSNWSGYLYYHKNANTTYGPFTVEEAIFWVENSADFSWTEGYWSLSAAEGTYWNLNNGQLFANKFELNAWKNREIAQTIEPGVDPVYKSDSKSGGLYLNSDPTADGMYLSIGNTSETYLRNKDGILINEKDEVIADANDNYLEGYDETHRVIDKRPHFIQYQADGNLKIQMNDFVLNAWEDKEKAQSGLILDSDPVKNTGHWLLIGNTKKNDAGDIVENSFIDFRKNGDRDELIIQIGSGDKLELNAWNPDAVGVGQGIYLNSEGYNTPSGDSIYFRAGRGNDTTNEVDLSNIIEVSKNRVLIGASTFVLDAWSHQMYNGYNEMNKSDWEKLNEGVVKDSYWEKGGIYLTNYPVIQSMGDYTGWDSYFKMGNGKHFIQYTGDHQLLMNINKFTLDAFDNDTKEGIYFDSDPVKKSDYYMQIGNKNNFIKLTKGGELTFQTNNKFVVNAWNDGGLYINSSPSQSEDYYLRIGNGTTSEISYTRSGTITIKANQFTLDAYSGTGGLYLTNTPNMAFGYFVLQADEKNYIELTQNNELKICVENLTLGGSDLQTTIDGLRKAIQNTPNVDKAIEAYLTDNVGMVIVDGKYYVSANYINVPGKFTASMTNNTVSIAGWSISNTGIYKNGTSYRTGMYSSWDDGDPQTISGLESTDWRFVAGNASKYLFGVTRDGQLAASSGMIGGWSLSEAGLISSSTTCGFIGDTDKSNLMSSSLVISGESPIRFYTGAGKLKTRTGTILKRSNAGAYFSSETISPLASANGEYVAPSENGYKVIDTQCLSWVADIPLMYAFYYDKSSDRGNFGVSIPYETSPTFYSSIYLDKLENGAWVEQSSGIGGLGEGTLSIDSKDVRYVIVRPLESGTYRVSIYITSIITVSSMSEGKITGILKHLSTDLTRTRYFETLNEIGIERGSVSLKTSISRTAIGATYNESYPRYGNESIIKGSRPNRLAVWSSTMEYTYAPTYTPPENAKIRLLDDGSAYVGAIDCEGKINLGGSLYMTPGKLIVCSGSSSSNPCGLNGYFKLTGTLDTASGILITSHRHNKHSIESLDERYINLFDLLHPVRFKYNDGSSGRYHAGLILDELKNAMDQSGLTTIDVAAYCLNDKNDTNSGGGIRYTDLISVIVAKVQQMDKENKELQSQVLQLQEIINNFEEIKEKKDYEIN